MIVDDPSDNLLLAIVTGALFGQFIGQFNLVSIWASISCGSPIIRLPWALLLTVLMWASLFWGMQAWSHQLGHDGGLMIGVILAFGCVVTQIPLWIASRIFHWQLVPPQWNIATNSSSDSGQFQLQQMLIGMALLASTLSVARNLVTEKEWEQLSLREIFMGQAAVFLFALAICNLLLALPAVWAAFYVQPSVRFYAIMLGIFVLVGLAEFGGICLVIGGPGSQQLEWATVFCTLNFAQTAVVYFTLRVLRNFGFQLIRTV